MLIAEVCSFSSTLDACSTSGAWQQGAAVLLRLFLRFVQFAPKFCNNLLQIFDRGKFLLDGLWQLSREAVFGDANWFRSITQSILYKKLVTDETFASFRRASDN
jgi:hypothetical protein